jgi:hypothetical protein
MSNELPLDPYGMGSIFHILFEYTSKTAEDPEILKVSRVDAICYFMSRHGNELTRNQHDPFLTAFRGSQASWGSLFNSSYGMIAKNDSGLLPGRGGNRNTKEFRLGHGTRASGDYAPFIRLATGHHRLTKPGRIRAALVAAKLERLGYV